MVSPLIFAPSSPPHSHPHNTPQHKSLTPSRADLTDNNSRVQFIKKALSTIGDAEKQLVGILMSLLSKTAAKSSVNGMDTETLAALFAPFVVDGKWLNHKIPPAIKLKKPFKI